MYVPAQILPNEQSMVERKLHGTFCHVHIQVPFDYYETFAEQAYEGLRDYGIKIDLIDVVENPLLKHQFEQILQSVASEVRFDDLDYAPPKLDVIYQAEIREAKRLREEADQEAKRIAIAAEEAQRLREAMETTTIKVSLENEAKARAILSLAGLL